MTTPALHYCATLSAQADEALYGTANHKTRWLILEYSRIWGAQALHDSDLPETVKQQLKDYLAANAFANQLFIRQHGRKSDRLAFYIAEVEESGSRLYAYALDRYEDLLEIDFDLPVPANLSDETLYLVCANAKRDACCATYGLPVYKALRQQVAEQAWMSTHQGGHRFAATMLVLPQGLHYGRLRDTDVPGLVEQTQAGQIVLEKLRGRVCYEPQVQAADYLLRNELGLSAIDALRLEAVAEVAPDLWDLRFDAAGSPKEIRLERVQTDVEIFTSCSNDKTGFVEDYRLVSRAGS
jgi:hypothetical protein